MGEGEEEGVRNGPKSEFENGIARPLAPQRWCSSPQEAPVSRVVHVICPRLFPWAGSHGFMTSAWAECHKTAGTRAQRALPTSSLFSLFLWFLHPIPCLIPIYTLVLCLALDSGCILHNPTGLSRDLRPLLLYAQTAEVCPVICSLPIFVCSSCM